MSIFKKFQNLEPVESDEPKEPIALYVMAIMVVFGLMLMLTPFLAQFEVTPCLQK